MIYASSYGLFGSGSDGAVVFDGVTTPVAGATLAGSTYTLTRDVMAAGLTVNAGVTVKTAQFRLFATGTVVNNGTISNAGANAVAGAGAVGTGSAQIGRAHV